MYPGSLPFSFFLLSFVEAPPGVETTTGVVSGVVDQYPQTGFTYRDAACTASMCSCPYLWASLHQPDSRITLPSTRRYNPHSIWWLRIRRLALKYSKSLRATLQLYFCLVSFVVSSPFLRNLLHYILIFFISASTRGERSTRVKGTPSIGIPFFLCVEGTTSKAIGEGLVVSSMDIKFLLLRRQ